MFKSLIPLLCFGFITNPVTGQPDPITIQFVETQPIWEHLVWDTSFYSAGSQPEINKYTVVRPHKSFRYHDDLFNLSPCIRYNGEDWGYIID